MEALQLYDKFNEECIGTVLLKENVQLLKICNAWDHYQIHCNSNTENEADIYDFVSKGNWGICEVLEIDFYQPR